MNFSGIASQRLKRHRAQSKLEFKGHSKHKVSTKSMRVRELNSKTNRKVTGF